MSELKNRIFKMDSVLDLNKMLVENKAEIIKIRSSFGRSDVQPDKKSIGRLHNIKKTIAWIETRKTQLK